MMRPLRGWAQRCLRRSLLAACLVGLAPTQALAGRPCDSPQALSPAVLTQALDLAARTWRALDDSGADVVVLARAGQDLTQYGLQYSHLGLAYRTQDSAGRAVWRVAHKLNQCGAATADIYRQGLGDFFLDDLWRYQAAWLVPTRELQQSLLPLLRDDARLLQLHASAYSMVAYPWSTRYQQSNQWALETMALAMSTLAPPALSNRAQVQDWLQRHGFVPTTLKLGALTRLGARMFKANVAFDDHPNEKRYADRIETVTVDAVFAWMQRAGLSTQPVVTLP